jgi:hypothetical protein
VTAVHAKHELTLAGHHAYEPLSHWRKRNWKRCTNGTGLREDTYESDNIRRRRPTPKRILSLQLQKIAPVAQRNLRVERQLTQ